MGLPTGRDRDFGSVTSPYALGDERQPGPHVKTGKWLELAAGAHRKLVPIRLVRALPACAKLLLLVGMPWDHMQSNR